MRDLKKSSRISARSIPEVIEAMMAALAHCGSSRRVQFRGRKLSIEAFVNGMLIHFLAQPREEQIEALRAAVARLEDVLARDEGDPGNLDLLTRLLETNPPRIVEGKSIDSTMEEIVPPRAERPRRRKAGDV